MCWLSAIWHRRQRAIDRQILWPICRSLTPTLADARAVFTLHAYQDRAWLALGDAEMARLIEQLPAQIVIFGTAPDV